MTTDTSWFESAADLLGQPLPPCELKAESALINEDAELTQAARSLVSREHVVRYALGEFDVER